MKQVQQPTTLVPPNETLYLSNLNDKINKKELKQTLYHAFSPFGMVLDVVALKTASCRGQAFIVFSTIDEARTALDSCQGMVLFRKPMSIAFAKTKSKKIRHLNGDFTPILSAAAALSTTSTLKRAREQGVGNEAVQDEERDEASVKRSKDAEATRILFLSALPPSATIPALTSLFSVYGHFVEVRMVPGRPGIAFVEYSNVTSASNALTVLNGFSLGGHRISVEFGKQ